MGGGNLQPGEADDSEGHLMMRLISGDQKMVQMIPLELTAARAASSNGHSANELNSLTKSGTPSLHPHARSSVIVHESTTNESNSNFDDLEDEEDGGPFDEEAYDNADYEGASSPKRLKIDLSASSSGAGQQSLEAEDSGRSMDGLSVASSVCSSLETENTHSSCTSLSQAGGKKRKQSNPKKVVASAETKTAEGGNSDAPTASGEAADEEEADEENETEEKMAAVKVEV